MVTIKLDPIVSNVKKNQLVSLSVLVNTDDQLMDGIRDHVLGDFLIDSGATKTMVLKQTAEYQGFQKIKSDTAFVKYGNGEIQAWETVLIPKIYIGSVIFSNIEALAVDIPEIETLKLAGVIGLDILSKGFTIDFKNKVMIYT